MPEHPNLRTAALFATFRFAYQRLQRRARPAFYAVSATCQAIFQPLRLTSARSTLPLKRAAHYIDIAGACKTFLQNCDLCELSLPYLVDGTASGLQLQTFIDNFFAINFYSALLDHTHGFRGTRR